MNTDNWMRNLDLFMSANQSNVADSVTIPTELKNWFKTTKIKILFNELGEIEVEKLRELMVIHLFKDETTSKLASSDVRSKILLHNSKKQKSILEWLDYFDKFITLKQGNISRNHIDDDLFKWLKSSISHITNGRCADWKSQLFKSYDLFEYSNDLLQPKTDSDIILEAGQRKINDELRLIDKQNLDWIKYFNLFKEYRESNNKNKTEYRDKGFLKWLNLSKDRYAKRKLPRWKMDILIACDFDSFIIGDHVNYAEHASMLRIYQEKFGSYAVENRKGFSDIYQMRLRLVLLQNKQKTNLLFSFIENSGASDINDFLRPANFIGVKDEAIEIINTEEFGIKPEDENDFDLEIMQKFGNMSAIQTNKILRRLSSVAFLEEWQYKVLSWTTSFVNINESLIAQNCDLFSVNLKYADYIFVRENRSLYLSGKLSAWKIKYLEPLNFVAYANDIRSASSNERSLINLRDFYAKNSNLLVTSDVDSQLYEWRKRMARQLRATPKEKLQSSPVYIKIKNIIPNISFEEINSFMFDLPSLRGVCR